MPDDRHILLAMLREASRQSAPFQSLIQDFSWDVMNDPEAHVCFTTRLNQNLPMLRRIEDLKTWFKPCSTDGNDISRTMNEVLKAVSALPAASHTNQMEIANLVAVELAYRRIDQRLDEPLAVDSRA